MAVVIAMAHHAALEVRPVPPVDHAAFGTGSRAIVALFPPAEILALATLPVLVARALLVVVIAMVYHVALELRPAPALDHAAFGTGTRAIAAFPLPQFPILASLTRPALLAHLLLVVVTAVDLAALDLRPVPPLELALFGTGARAIALALPRPPILAPRLRPALLAPLLLVVVFATEKIVALDLRAVPPLDLAVLGPTARAIAVFPSIRAFRTRPRLVAGLFLLVVFATVVRAALVPHAVLTLALAPLGTSDRASLLRLRCLLPPSREIRILTVLPVPAWRWPYRPSCLPALFLCSSR